MRPAKKVHLGQGLAFVAAAALLVPAATAQAEATVEHFEFTTPITDFVPSDECRPDVSAIGSGTDVLVGQRVLTPPPSSAFNLHGSITTTLTFRFSDGSYGVGGGTERFAGSGLNVGSTFDALTAVTTFVHVDSITIYDANGQLIGTQTFRAVHHGTVRDLPPLGGPPGDEDIVRVEFAHARLTCDV
jgi:hypothetical protein